MFLDFMKPDPTIHSGHAAFPGVILLSAPISNSTPVEVVAYAIGDFEDGDSYEVITAWTAENYRNMNLAMTVRTYTHTHAHTHTHTLSHIHTPQTQRHADTHASHIHNGTQHSLTHSRFSAALLPDIIRVPRPPGARALHSVRHDQGGLREDDLLLSGAFYAA